MRLSILRSRDHCIICGGGDVAREIVREFQRVHERFVVVDRDPEHSELAGEEGVPFVAGDAGEDEVLERAGIRRARALIAALPDDQANVLVVLTARQLNPELKIVARATDHAVARKLVKVGANRVISPTQIAGRRMASLILHPSLVNYLDVMVEGKQLAMRIEEVRVAPRSPLVDATLREAGIGSHTGAVIIGIIDPDGEARFNATGTSSLSGVTLREGDNLIALGSEEQLAALREFAARGVGRGAG
jgi:voltage-gated potassium channel